MWLVDINPWIPHCTDSLFFEWDEIIELSNQYDDGELNVDSVTYKYN